MRRPDGRAGTHRALFARPAASLHARPCWPPCRSPISTARSTSRPCAERAHVGTRPLWPEPFTLSGGSGRCVEVEPGHFVRNEALKQPEPENRHAAPRAPGRLAAALSRLPRALGGAARRSRGCSTTCPRSAGPGASCGCWSAARATPGCSSSTATPGSSATTATLELVPDILAAYEVEEGRVFTFHLRRGHSWSDGQPFTTEDFRFFWEDVALEPELSPTGPEIQLAGRRRAAEGRDPGRAHRPLQLVASPTRCSCPRWRRRPRS